MSIMRVVDGDMSMGLVSVVEVLVIISFEVSCHSGLWVLVLFCYFWDFYRFFLIVMVVICMSLLSLSLSFELVLIFVPF